MYDQMGVAGKADCRPLGGRQEMGPGSRAGQGAASKLQEIASYWLPGKTLSVTVQVFCDLNWLLKYFPYI